MPIPKTIMTMWLTFKKEPWPELVQKCIESQKIPGYEHVIITLDNCYRGSKYVNEALAKAEDLYKAGDPSHTKWLVKASDWLRCYHAREIGCVYLDSDMYVLPGKNFDDLLDNRFFTENEVFGNAANAGFGTEAGHPILKTYMDRVENNFRGDGDLVYDPGIRTFSDIFWQADKKGLGIKIYPTDLFFPYNHSTGEVHFGENTRVLHLYCGSWYEDQSRNKIAEDYKGEGVDDLLKKYEQRKIN